MPQSQASFFRDDPAVALRTPEVPNADWDTGMNYGSCNPGVGISTENPDLDESLPNWTLLDQFEDPRAGQISQLIGGPGYTPAAGYPSSGGQEGTLPDNVIRMADEALLTGDGNAATGATGNATLVDLDVGWTSVP